MGCTLEHGRVSEFTFAQGDRLGYQCTDLGYQAAELGCKTDLGHEDRKVCLAARLKVEDTSTEWIFDPDCAGPTCTGPSRIDSCMRTTARIQNAPVCEHARFST